MNSGIERSRKAERGFTLIEIAIVLVILGLLLGGVLQGQRLIENSRIKSATNDFHAIARAAASYQDRYGRVPGDDGPLASLQGRGGAWAAVANPGLLAGNADGVLDVTLADTFAATGEGAALFQHLRSAGFVAGDPATLALPHNPFGGVIGITSDATALGALGGSKLCMSKVSGAAGRSLDMQLDDGAPDSGRFRASTGQDLNIPLAAAATAYDEELTYTVCYRL